MKLLWLLLVPSIAVADPRLRHEDPQLVRPELKELVVVRSIPKGTGLVEESREIRLYDAKGHLTRHEHRKPDGSIVVAYDYQWDAQGRIASHTYKDQKRSERRDFTYKVDAQGRVIEKIMRDPAAPAGEYYRYESTWHAGGGRDERAYRHYPNGGPFEDGTEVFDASGRPARRCRGGGGCSLYEYDAHGNVSRVREQMRGDRHWYRSSEHTYDKANRVATREIGNRIESFTYNARGDVAEIAEHLIPAQGGALQAKSTYTYRYR